MIEVATAAAIHCSNLIPTPTKLGFLVGFFVFLRCPLTTFFFFTRSPLVSSLAYKIILLRFLKSVKRFSKKKFINRQIKMVADSWQFQNQKEGFLIFCCFLSMTGCGKPLRVVRPFQSDISFLFRWDSTSGQNGAAYNLRCRQSRFALHKL